MRVASPPKQPFKCPVCRASQPLQIQCRRCHADLSLVISVRSRLAYLLQLRDEVNTTKTMQQAIDNEIQWLSPKPDYH